MTDLHGTAHGKLSTYNKGCRCDSCREVKAAASREFYLRHRERLRARNLARYYANAEQAKAQAQRWQRANREKVRGYVAKWTAKNPDWERQWVAANPDKVAAKTRRYNQSEKGRDYYRRWQRDNADRVKAAGDKWRKANPDKVRQRGATQRFKRRGAETFRVTPNDWRRLCLRYDNACCYCGSTKPLTQDHVIPLSRGGRHSIGNIVPACLSCNSSKNNRLIVEWRAGRRRAA